MRITEHEIAALFLGAAIGSIVTYWNMTREKRIIRRVHNDIDFVRVFHNLPPEQYRKAQQPSKLISDAKLLELYRWAENVCRMFKRDHRVKLSPVRLTAEAIICSEVLGLDPGHASRALFKAVQERIPLDKISTLLPFPFP